MLKQTPIMMPLNVFLFLTTIRITKKIQKRGFFTKVRLSFLVSKPYHSNTDLNCFCNAVAQMLHLVRSGFQ